jgi:hypothetical protein
MAVDLDTLRCLQGVRVEEGDRLTPGGSGTRGDKGADNGQGGEKELAHNTSFGDSGQAQHCIKTLYGRGYRFVAAVTVHATMPGNDG